MIKLSPVSVPENRLGDDQSLQKEIEKSDSSGMLRLLREFPEQAAAARKLTEQPTLETRVPPKAIIFSGLGGSAICGDLIRDSFSDQLNVPVAVNRDYHLPGWVNRETLSVLISYSGNTEETLSAYREAKARGAGMAVVTSGGKLAQMAADDNVPRISLPGGYPPRTALGYIFFGAVNLLTKAGVLQISDKLFSEALGAIRATARISDPQAGFAENPARRLAAALKGTIPVIYSGDRLSAAAFRWKTQFEENSKNLSFTGTLPEMNHNEVVGWERPAETLKRLSVLFLRDREEDVRVKERFKITADLLQPRNLLCEVESKEKNRLARLFSIIVFGDWVSYYLSLENGTDPTPVERITLLKKRLAEK